eukprot:m.263197 g.263197  ORF g.263197 m.263197 type:complete len:78 (+) comp40454_c0_seq5:103-336(+)
MSYVRGWVVNTYERLSAAQVSFISKLASSCTERETSAGECMANNRERLGIQPAWQKWEYMLKMRLAKAVNSFPKPDI